MINNFYAANRFGDAIACPQVGLRPLDARVQVWRARPPAHDARRMAIQIQPSDDLPA
jgi:hypothetical protein